MLKHIVEYDGKYKKEIQGKFSKMDFVVIPKEKVHFLHLNTLSSNDITMGVFEENNIIYLMSYVFYDKNKNFMECALDNVRKSDYTSISEVENDKKVDKSGYTYYEMDSIYYCEWCNRYR